MRGVKGLCQFRLSLVLWLIWGCAAAGGSVRNEQLARDKHQLGVSYLNAGALSLAQKELLEALELAPKDPLIHVAIGRNYFAQKRHTLALDSYSKALVLDPKLSIARFYLGTLYLDMKRWDDAIRELRSITNDPTFESLQYVHNNIGLAHLEKGEYPQAIREFKKAIDYQSDFAEVHHNLGLVYFRLGNREMAIEEYREALRLYPQFARARLDLAVAYAEIGDKEQATRELTRVIELSPQSALADLSQRYLESLRQTGRIPSRSLFVP